MMKLIHLALSLLFFLGNITFAQDFLNEKVKFLLDSWKYNFGWETLGGGYIRHILFFTDSNIVDVKTDQISHTPNVNSSGFTSDNLYLLPLTAILNTLLEKISPDPKKEMNEQIKTAINLASENPTVENYFNALSLILKKKKLKCEIKEVIPYNEIQDLDVKRKGEEVRLKFKYKNKKYEFISNQGSPELAEKVRNVLNEIFKGESGKNYVSILQEKVKESMYEFKETSLYIEGFGQGLFLSLNLDYRFHKNFSFSIGSSFLLLGFGVPLSLHYISNANSNHHFEAGVGVLFFDGERKSITILTSGIGYRYQRPNGGLFFKALITPIYFPEEPNLSLRFPFIIGISTGYTF